MVGQNLSAHYLICISAGKYIMWTPLDHSLWSKVACESDSEKQEDEIRE